jgi:hypothetical protein
MESTGIPSEVTGALRDLLDCNIYFFDKKVDEPVMYLILGGCTLLLIALYIILNTVASRKPKK